MVSGNCHLNQPMNEPVLMKHLLRNGQPTWRYRLADWIESKKVQNIVIVTILLNAVILGLETSPAIKEGFGGSLKIIDKLCLIVFIVELLIKLTAYRWHFFRSGWNVFDFLVVGVALVPNAGPWAVLRSLRILRVLRLLTVAPSLRKVVTAFIHAIPGLSGVILVMAVFFYTMGVLSTNLFGDKFPEWFGTLGQSLFSLFQIMTLESWSMGIVRPVMEAYPWAWAFFVPFIIVATFTILNLFIGIIVSTMQELATTPNPEIPQSSLDQALERMEKDIASLRKQISENTNHRASPSSKLSGHGETQ